MCFLCTQANASIAIKVIPYKSHGELFYKTCGVAHVVHVSGAVYDSTMHRGTDMFNACPLDVCPSAHSWCGSYKIWFSLISSAVINNILANTQRIILFAGRTWYCYFASRRLVKLGVPWPASNLIWYFGWFCADWVV